MVLFGFIMVVSVAALLAVRKMDIECENPQPAKRRTVVAAQPSKFPAEGMGLRRI